MSSEDEGNGQVDEATEKNNNQEADVKDESTCNQEIADDIPQRMDDTAVADLTLQNMANNKIKLALDARSRYMYQDRYKKSNFHLIK